MYVIATSYKLEVRYSEYREQMQLGTVRAHTHTVTSETVRETERRDDGVTV